MWGGTSLASPIFAALQADAQQAMNGKIGFANPQIYEHYGQSSLQDITGKPVGAPGLLFGVARNEYADPHDPASAISTHFHTPRSGRAAEGHASYGDATGVGAPSTTYIQSYIGCQRQSGPLVCPGPPPNH